MYIYIDIYIYIYTYIGLCKLIYTLYDICHYILIICTSITCKYIRWTRKDSVKSLANNTREWFSDSITALRYTSRPIGHTGLSVKVNKLIMGISMWGRIYGLHCTIVYNIRGVHTYVGTDIPYREAHL